MDIKKTVGNRLNSALALRDMKQKELAKALGVTDNTVSYFCSGSRLPNTQQIITISEVLCVSSDYLLGLSDDPSPCPSAVDELGLSTNVVELINHLNMLDTPNGQISFQNASAHAMDIMNSLFETEDIYYGVISNLLLCFDSYWVNTKHRKLTGDDFELEEDLRDAGHIILTGNDAAKFYANEAANALKNIACNEIPILVNSLIEKEQKKAAMAATTAADM